MKNWQIKINNIMEEQKENEDKVKEFQCLRSELVGELHKIEGYVDKVDYCLHQLKKQ